MVGFEYLKTVSIAATLYKHRNIMINTYFHEASYRNTKAFQGHHLDQNRNLHCHQLHHHLVHFLHLMTLRHHHLFCCFWSLLSEKEEKRIKHKKNNLQREFKIQACCHKILTTQIHGRFNFF